MSADQMLERFGDDRLVVISFASGSQAKINETLETRNQIPSIIGRIMENRIARDVFILPSDSTSFQEMIDFDHKLHTVVPNLHIFIVDTKGHINHSVVVGAPDDLSSEFDEWKSTKVKGVAR